jgi:hypothetical protein
MLWAIRRLERQKSFGSPHGLRQRRLASQINRLFAKIGVLAGNEGQRDPRRNMGGLPFGLERIARTTAMG